MNPLVELLLVCADPREGAALERELERPVFVTGVGKAAAACSVAARLARHQVGLVLLFGVAGSLPSDTAALDVLDLAFASESVFGDEGVATPEGFLGLDALGLGSNAPLAADHERTAIAARLLGDLPTLRVATVSTCSGTDALAKALALRSGAQLETMESAAVALACRRFAVPMIELRCISNRTGDRDRAGFRLPEACARVQDAVATLVRSGALVDDGVAT